jgi:hypothetical protein
MTFKIIQKKQEYCVNINEYSLYFINPDGWGERSHDKQCSGNKQANVHVLAGLAPTAGLYLPRWPVHRYHTDSTIT